MGLTRIRAEQISDIDYKQSVRVITLTDIVLSGGAPSTVDGVNLSTGDRILVNGQSNAAQNGLYQVQTLGTGENGTWVRTSDANQDGEIQPGMVVMVTQGTVYADTPWKLVTNGVIVIGTTELIFQENYSLAFGNIFANGTAVIANTVSAGLTLTAGDNISITGNNASKTVTIGVTGINLSGIANGTSNVNIAVADGNVTTAVNGNTIFTVTGTGANVAGYLDVVGNVVGGNVNTAGLASINDLVISGNITGNLLPSANITYDLGSDTARWNDLYLSNSTIYLGNAQISANSTSLILTNPEGAQTVFSGEVPDLSVDTVTATGNVTAGNLVTSGDVSTATVTASGNIITTGNIDGGNIIAGNAVITNDVSATAFVGATANISGNIQAGNIESVSLISANAITTSGNLESNNVIATNDVGANTVTATGNITGGNITTAGVVDAATVTATGNITGGNITTLGEVTATGNINSGNLITTGLASTATLDVSGNANVGNLGTAGQITAVGNITGDYFIGNGSQLTGISTSTNQIFNGTSNVDIATANADITMSVSGVSNVVVVSTDGITVTGNVIGNGIPTTTVSATPPADPEQGDVWIDSDTGIQLIYFNDGNSSQWAEMEAATSIAIGSGSANVDLSAVDQDIIPAANATYSLGNATNRWANLFLVGNTIDLGGAQIKADSSSGAIALIPAATVESPNPAALVISTTGGINVVETAGGEISGNAIANAAATSSPVGAPRITQITVTDDSYSPTGATAVALAGGYVQITGNGFQSGCQAIIGSNNATATGFQSSEILDVEVPAQSAGSYIVYLVNPDGAVALRPNGITYSGLPTWVTGSTLPSQTKDVAISIQLEATSDSAVTYSLQAGSSLPANVSLSSAGLISGTVTELAESTVYSFTVLATDAELQASPRSFDMSVELVTDFSVEYLVVAGGGGGGSGTGAGGGAGGFRTGTLGERTAATNYTLTVGAGGAGGSGAWPSVQDGFNGSSSVFSSITSAGGGGGGANATGTSGPGKSGGSGGGGGAHAGGGTPGGAGNTPATSPSQGNNGGSGSTGGVFGAGGGGGASAVGVNGTSSVGGNGGAGAASSITGISVTYAGGGGGGTFGGGTVGSGGAGGGGASTVPGTANTGGGGGGSKDNLGTVTGSGGSGVVILKYANTLTISNPGGGLTFTTSTAVAGYKITTFTAGTGNVQWS